MYTYERPIESRVHISALTDCVPTGESRAVITLSVCVRLSASALTACRQVNHVLYSLSVCVSVCPQVPWLRADR